MKEKDEIRAAMRERRRSVPAAERGRAAEALRARLLERDDVRAAMAARLPFAVYLAGRDELDLAPFIAELWAADVTVAVPCWNASAGEYSLGVYDNTTTLVQGAHRIAEPADPQPIAAADVGVWIVPGLAFTRGGGRIGYGGGWYDRLLRGAAPDAVTLGVAYDFQVLEVLPAELHDQMLSGVVTVDDAGEL